MYHFRSNTLVTLAILLLTVSPSRAQDNQTDSVFSVFMCGTSSPIATTDRAQACIAVIAGDDLYVFDSGARSTLNMQRENFDFSKLRGVVITHMHSDHIAEIPELNFRHWLAGQPTRMQVYGPPGIETVVEGLNLAYSLDHGYRNAHHGDELLPLETSPMQAVVVSVEPGTILNPFITDGELTISAIAVDHDPIRPAYAYRVDYAGKSIVISGDTVVVPSMIEAARDVDILFHDTMSTDIINMIVARNEAAGNTGTANLIRDVLDYHATTENLGQLANEANVKQLVLYHLVPAPANEQMEAIFVSKLKEVRDEYTLADDRQWFHLLGTP